MKIPLFAIEIVARSLTLLSSDYGKVYRATRTRTIPPPSAPSSSFNPINPSPPSIDLPEVVALKEIYIRPEQHEDGYSMYSLREISLLRFLKHENVIRLIDVAVGGTRPEDFWMVLEYVQQVSWRPFPNSQISCWFLPPVSGALWARTEDGSEMIDKVSHGEHESR